MDWCPIKAESKTEVHLKSQKQGISSACYEPHGLKKDATLYLLIYCFILTEMEELAEHGITLPPNMQGLTEEQVEELKLKDEWADKCVPQGGVRDNKDPIGRRNGQGMSLIWRTSAVLKTGIYRDRRKCV